MNLGRLPKAGRAAITTLTLICTAGQQRLRAVDVFDQPASWGNFAQLTTAVLTLPADLAATAKPTNAKRKLINHLLKLANELLAIWQQHSAYNATWACFDTIQSIKTLNTLMATTQIALSNQINEEQGIEAPVDNQAWQVFVHRADYILACAEAATRMWAARTNNTQPWEDLGNTTWERVRGALHEKSECAHSLTSLIRLARYCLQAPDKKQMAAILVLFIANIVATIWQYRTTDKPVGPGHQLGGQTTSNTTTTATQQLAAVQTHRPLGSNPAFNVDDFTTCVEHYAQDLRQQNGHANISINFGNALDAWCQERHIAPFFGVDDKSPLINSFNDFWIQVQQDNNGANRPFFMRQFFGQPYDTPNTLSTREFCRRFAAFYQQELLKTPQPTATVAQPQTPAPSVFTTTAGHTLQNTTEVAHDTAPQVVTTGNAPFLADNATTTVHPTKLTPSRARAKNTWQTPEDLRSILRASADRRKRPVSTEQKQAEEQERERIAHAQSLGPVFVDPSTTPNA